MTTCVEIDLKTNDTSIECILMPEHPVEPREQCPDCTGLGYGYERAHWSEDHDSTFHICGRCSGSGILTAKDLPPFHYGKQK